MTAPSRSWTPARAWVLELCLLAPSLAAGIGLGRLTDAPGAARVVTPVVLAVVLGQLAAAAGRRLGTAVSLLLGAIVVTLVTVWWFEPSTVVWGLPTGRTVHAVGHALSEAVTVTRHAPTPVVAVSSVVMCVSAGAGFAAVVGRALLPWPWRPARRRALVWALAPCAGLFAYASLLSSGVDRVQAAGAYIGALVVVVLVADRLGPGAVAPVPGRGALTGTVTVAVVVAVGASLAAGPSLGGAVPHVFLSATARTGPGVGGGRISSVADTVALVDDVGSLLSAGRGDVLFTARSDEPTYWQVAVLTTFDGRSWRPPPSTWTAIDGLDPAGLPPATAEPPVTSTFTGEIQVAGLRSTLLPVPPGTLALFGPGTRFDARVGGLFAAGTAAGTRYSFVAGAPAGAPGPDAAPSDAAGPAAVDLGPYLRLPKEPARVVSLAHRLVAGAASPFAKASALARYFDSGRFRYSLAARQAAGDPLESFLFDTRTGFCQQFAGAYAVLARIDGLPTRVAVGFDAGVGQGRGRYVVTAADAHVWPEVYLGPATGWVSFEPTPPAGTSSVVAAGVVYGSADVPGAGSPNGSGSPVTTNPKEKAGGAATATSSPSPGAARGGVGARASGRGVPGGGGVPTWLLVALGCVAAVAILATGRGRLADLVTAVRTRALAPSPAVAVHWRRAVRAFERRDGARGQAETMAEHAERMRDRFPAAAEPYSALAGLASRASYSGESLGPADVTRAQALCAQTRRALRRRRPHAGAGRVRPGR